LVLINVHAPTEDKDEIEKELFYATLEDVFNTSVGQVRLILGNFNAKIGKEQFHRSTVGIYSLHATSNDNGSKLIDFVVGKGLVIKSTMFPKEGYIIYTSIPGYPLMENIRTR